MSLVEKVSEKWKEITGHHGSMHRPMNVKDASDLAQQAQRLFNDEQLKSPQVANLLSYLNALYTRNAEYKAAEKVLKRIDMTERVRYLCFRIATAAGIATVILLTGLIAQCAGIPLPLLRIAA